MFAFESVAQENVPVTLEIARWMTIFIAGFAVIKAVMVIGRHEINSLRLKFFNRHIIVCGLNNKGAVLIDSCLNRPAAGKIIVIEPDRENDLAAIYHDKGVIVINGNPTDPSVLKKARVSRASYLFALTNNDECNVEIALKAYQIIRPSAVNTSGPEGQDILNCYVHVFDSNLQALFKQHALFRDPFDRFNGRVINIYETSARLVFNLYPPDRLNGARFRQLDSPPAHIVVVGFGNLGKNVTLQAIRLGHYANLKRTAISVLDLDIKAREKKFKAVYPGIESLVEINFREIDPESLNLEEIKKLNDRYPVSVVYVCIEDDSAGFLTASRLARELEDSADDSLSGVKAIVCMPENTGLSSVLELSSSLKKPDYDILEKPDNLLIFNTISESCSWAVLVDKKLDQVAITLHNDYLKSQDPGQRQKKAGARKWEDLPEEYRDSNRLKADFLSVRQRAIFSYYNITGHEDIPPDFESNHELIHRLAQMEHRRWMAEKFLSGWRYSGHRDDKRKKNDNLVEWEKLKGLGKENVIDLNLDDSRSLRKMIELVFNIDRGGTE